MGLTMIRKRDKNLAIRRKNHYLIKTLLACFHVCPLSRSSFILEFRNAVFSRGGGGGTLGLRDLEKVPGTKARTNNRLYPHLAIGGNGTRGVFSRIRHPCCRWRLFIILIEFSSCLCVSEGNIYV